MADSQSEKPLRKISESFKELAAIVNSEGGDVEVASLSRACSFVSPLFDSLGLVFKFAEMDYVAKVADLEEASKSILTLQALLDRDIEANCVRKAGSHSRNLLRVNRGLLMTKALYEQLLAVEGDSIKDAFQTAYTEVFGPYHGWALRKAVVAAIYTLPTKGELMKRLNEEEASARILMQSYVASSAAVIAYIEKLFHSRQLGIDW